MSDLFDILSDEARRKLNGEDFPEWRDPMLATLVDEAFSDADWIYERKLDGERVLAYGKGGETRLLSRNRKELGDAYPELIEALSGAGLPDFVADGEVVAFDGAVTSFQKLQPRMQVKDPDKARQTGVNIFYYLFDLVHLDGRDVRELALRDRKRLLRNAFGFSDPIRFASHRNEHGVDFYEEACASGWEGLIAKDATATYVGSRSRKWLKFKCVNEQEFVIGGYTDPQGERSHFGALLIGYYDGEDLVYAGKVGTGYDEETLEGLGSRMKSLERETSPFDKGDPSSDAHWVTPKLVAQIGFTEWTSAGKLRHPRYKGLRRDKPAEKVVRETPS